MRQILLMLTFTLPLLSPVFSQSFKLDKNEQGEIVERLCNLVRYRYYNEKQAHSIADSLLAYYENRRYQKAYYDEELAFMLNEDLYRLSNDKHLKVMPKFVEIVRINHYDVKKKWIHKIFPALFDKALAKNITRTLNAKKEKWYAESNYGLRSIQLLEGGIVYLRIDGFYDQSQAITQLQNALNSFKNTDYLLIDLSQFAGGQPNALAKFASYFVPEQTLLASVATKDLLKKGEKSEKAILLPLKAEKTDFSLKNKNIYVLTSKNTSGCAELFIHLLKKHCENVKIIGETTAGISTLVKEPTNRLEFVFGSGSSESVYYLASDRAIISTLELNLPEYQLLISTTDTTWAGKGITPDIFCSDTIVHFAHLRALKDKIKNESDYNTRQVIDFQETLLMMQSSHASKKPLSELAERFVGSYEKNRTIILENNTLYLKRGENEWIKLTPIGARTFLCETAYQSGFHFNNRLLPLFKIRFSENKDKTLKMTEIYADEMENRNIFLKINP